MPFQGWWEEDLEECNITFHREKTVNVQSGFKIIIYVFFLNPNVKCVPFTIYEHAQHFLYSLLLSVQAKLNKAGMLFTQIDTQC